MYEYVWNSKLSNLLPKMSNKYLCLTAINLFIGSKGPFYSVFPQNKPLAFKLLDEALSSTSDFSTIPKIKFSKAYLTKLHGVETGNPTLLSEGNSMLNLLCREEYPPALVNTT
jgi:hypothetical protein